MKCKICNNQTNHHFDKQVLNKYDVQYYYCPNCEFLQTEEPHWLNEAYAEALHPLDTGMVYRNIEISKLMNKFIKSYFDMNARFVDYGAGSGLFVRLMRDLGYNFFWYDKYSNNVFAKGIEVENCNKGFSLITSFETFEHFTNPISEIQKMINMGSNIVFGTELHTGVNLDNWSYLGAEHGQHISFYSMKTMRYLEKKFSLVFYEIKKNLYFLGKNKIKNIKYFRCYQHFINLIKKNNNWNFQNDHLTLKTKGRIEC